MENEKGAALGGGVGGKLALGEDGLSTGGGVRAEGDCDKVSREGVACALLVEEVEPKLRENDGAGEADLLEADENEKPLEGLAPKAGVGLTCVVLGAAEDEKLKGDADFFSSSFFLLGGRAGGAGDISSSASSASWSSSASEERSSTTSTGFFCFFSAVGFGAGEGAEDGLDRFELVSRRYSCGRDTRVSPGLREDSELKFELTAGIVRSSCSRGEISFAFSFSLGFSASGALGLAL